MENIVSQGVSMELTLTIPDELATRLVPVSDRLPQILEFGLREMDAGCRDFAGLADVLEVLARLPSPSEVLALRPSSVLQQRIEVLLARTETVACRKPSGSSGNNTSTSSTWCASPRRRRP